MGEGDFSCPLPLPRVPECLTVRAVGLLSEGWRFWRPRAVGGSSGLLSRVLPLPDLPGCQVSSQGRQSGQPASEQAQ